MFSCSSVLFNIMITPPEEERAGLYLSCVFVCLSCMHFVPSFSLSLGVRDWRFFWYQGLTASFDCGTHWALLQFFLFLSELWLIVR